MLQFDPVLKDCLSVMTPDETFLMRSDTETEDWFVQLLDKARQARATKLGRAVFREEYFEVSSQSKLLVSHNAF